MSEPSAADQPMFDEAILRRAWELRQTGIYTMREIAESLNVNREALISALERYWMEMQAATDAVRAEEQP